MGTNFYYRIDVCQPCGRYTEVHVGKQSAGWSFGFRAYQHRLMNADHPEWGFDPQSPLGFPIVSRADWRKAFTERAGELWDEYGRRASDPLIWLGNLLAPDPAQRHKEDQMTSYPSWMDGSAWRDPEGFRFDLREFS